MRGAVAIWLAIAAPALADGDPNILRGPGFAHSAIYHIEGLAIPVFCDCAKEVPSAFFIEVTAPFEEPRRALMAGFDMAMRVCAARGVALEAETAALSVVYEDGANAPTRWMIAGDCG